LRRRAAEDGREFYEISAVTNRGVRELVNAVAARLDELKAVVVDLGEGAGEDVGAA
jgi:hypothetical protein